MSKNLLVTLSILSLHTKICFSQTPFFNVKYQLETGTYFSTSGQTPFWLRSNQYGVVPLESQFVTFRGSAHREYDSTKNKNQKLKKFSYGYGAWGVVNVGKINQIILPEAYIKVRYGAFEFYGGRRREVVGLVDTMLTSGSYIWSGNALPMPKIQISIPNYTSIIGHGLISIKGSFAHGWFGNQTFTQNYFLHQKTLYGRIGKPHWKISLYSGFNHQVQWGGYSPALINDPYSSKNGFLPSDFNAFMNIAFPFPFIRKAFQPKIKLNYDSDNYGGNQLGTLDFAGELKLEKLKILVYRQLPYDLGSLFTSFVNADDGLYGASFKLYKPFLSINGITIEGFHSFNQGVYRSGIARLFNIRDKHFGELHSYLNHGQYIDGWSYKGLGIGTPLILSNNQLSDKSYQNEYTFSAFNKVKSIYGALEGKIAQFNYGIKVNYALYGRSGYVSNIVLLPQFSYILYTNFRIKNDYYIKFSQASDSGKMLNRSSSFSISILKNW